MSNTDATTVEPNATPEPGATPAEPTKALGDLDADPVKTAAALPDDPASLKHMIIVLLECLHERTRDYEAVQHRLALLLRRLYGPRTERSDPNQPLLFDQQAEEQTPPAQPPAEETPAEETPAEKTPKPKRTCRPHGRRPLPKHLPRVTQHCELSEEERTCATCGNVRVDIGTETREHLDYKPASLFVWEYVLHKYACPCCRKSKDEDQAEPQDQAESRTPASQTPTPVATDTTPPAQPQSAPDARVEEPAKSLQPAPEPVLEVVVVAPKPLMPIPGGLPCPGLLADLIVRKYVEHLPLYRLEASYDRLGYLLPRSTLCDWLLACGRLLRPLYDLLLNRILLSRVVHTDDTTVKLQDPKTHLLSTARLWGYLGDAANPFNAFDFTLNRKRDGPVRVLANYQGYLQADAFSGYDCLYLPDPLTTTARIHEVACNAHARRKFYEAQSSDLLRSNLALGYYRQLYELERQAKDFSELQRLQMRQDLAVPILKTFRVWIDKVQGEVLPKSPMAQALGYALNNWDALIRYTEKGFLAIDNNVAEREMKRIAIGRKNWLFVGSERGGETAAILMSFASSCHRLDINPWTYLQDVLTRLPGMPTTQRIELLPDRWLADRRVQQGSATVSGTDPPVPRDASAPPTTSAG